MSAAPGDPLPGPVPANSAGTGTDLSPSTNLSSANDCTVEGMDVSGLRVPGEVIPPEPERRTASADPTPASASSTGDVSAGCEVPACQSNPCGTFDGSIAAVEQVSSDESTCCQITPCRWTGASLTRLKSRSQADFEIEFFEQILSRDPVSAEVLLVLGDLFTEKGWYQRALSVDLRAAVLRPRDVRILYNLACSYARLRRIEEAVMSLRASVQCGFSDLTFLEADQDLDGIRNHPDYCAIVQSLGGEIRAHL